MEVLKSILFFFLWLILGCNTSAIASEADEQQIVSSIFKPLALPGGS